MNWFFLSLAAAISIAARDVSIKTYKDLALPEIAILEMLWALPCFLLGFLLVATPQLDRTFWWTFGLSVPINILAYILYLYAIKLSPISLSVPFLAFTPAFMILTGFFILAETINWWGGAGICLIVLGGYVLHLKKRRTGLLEPFAAFLGEKGSWLMLMVAILYSFAAVIGKKAMLHSSPLYFSYSFFLVFTIAVLTGLLLVRGIDWLKILHYTPRGLWLGILLMVHISFHGLAIDMSTAVYMVAVKRSSILFSVFLSWLILKEKNLQYRGVGTLLMFAGMLLITLLG